MTPSAHHQPFTADGAPTESFHRPTKRRLPSSAAERNVSFDPHHHAVVVGNVRNLASYSRSERSELWHDPESLLALRKDAAATAFRNAKGKLGDDESPRGLEKYSPAESKNTKARIAASIRAVLEAQQQHHHPNEDPSRALAGAYTAITHDCHVRALEAAARDALEAFDAAGVWNHRRYYFQPTALLPKEQQTTKTPQSSQPKRPKPGVSFDPNQNAAFEIPNLDSYSQSETSDIWYDDESLATIREHAFDTLYREGLGKLRENETSRGLEKYEPGEMHRARNRISSSIKAVLEAQQQLQTKATDDLALAKAYGRITQGSHVRALTAAAQDTFDAFDAADVWNRSMAIQQKS